VLSICLKAYCEGVKFIKKGVGGCILVFQRRVLERRESRRGTVGKILRFVGDDAVRLDRERQRPSLPHLGIDFGQQHVGRNDIVACGRS